MKYSKFIKGPENIELRDYEVKHRNTHAWKEMYFQQRGNNKILLWACTMTVAVSFMYGVGTCINSDKLRAEIASYKRLSEIGAQMSSDYAQREDQYEAALASCSAKLPKPKVSKGKVSYYSKDGCLGCSANQKMANGQIFNENAMTLAHNSIPLNTVVIVKNLDNGKQMTARITDRGGFGKYNRIADLSKGLYEAIGAKTDKSVVEISY